MATALSTEWKVPGVSLRDVTMHVPLDHDDHASPALQLFARIATGPGGEHKPYLVFLQGGPGSEAPRPLDASTPAWLSRALRDHQVVLLDQRGTGRSSPVGLDVALPQGAIEGVETLRQATAEQQAHYLTHFRADAIARDAELLRERLGAETWTLLGQSFGGFVTLRCLTAHADSVHTALFTGGLPVVGPHLDDVYATTWEGMVARSERFRSEEHTSELQSRGHLVCLLVLSCGSLFFLSFPTRRSSDLGAETWTLLGQSFGGFVTLRCLTAHADSVHTALFTGGLPVVGPHLDDVYATTWEGMVARSERFFARFPADRDRMRRLADRAEAGDLRLPDGQRVGVERLRRLGHLLGASQGAERLHLLLDLDPDSPAFAHDLAAALPFSGRNPLYSVIHESCWADGMATRWAAERTMPQAVREDPTLLAGEHVHRELFTEDPQLAPWAEAAEILAEHQWPRLYDEVALRGADVPGAAAVYYDDAYVPRERSMATAALLPRVRTWVTSEYEHNGLRASGEHVLDHLLDLAAGRRAA